MVEKGRNGDILWGEPVTKPNGEVVRLMISPRQTVRLYVGQVENSYLEHEVVILGRGDFERGVVRIGQAAYQSPKTSTDMLGTSRFFQDELEKPH